LPHIENILNKETTMDITNDEIAEEKNLDTSNNNAG